MNRRQFLATASLASVLAAKPALAHLPVFFTTSGLALGGYDTVSFFSQSGPRRGRRDIAIMWKGAIWYFAHPAHLDLFEADPWAFAPRYGGYCAYSVSQGALKGGDPRAWRIEAGRLYVTANRNARSVWLKDVHAHIARADAAWPDILLRG